MNQGSEAYEYCKNICHMTLICIKNIDHMNQEIEANESRT